MHEIHGGKQTPNAMRTDVRARKKRDRDPIRARSLARSRASPHADDARALAMFKTKAPAPKTAVKKSAPAKKAPAKKARGEEGARSQGGRRRGATEGDGDANDDDRDDRARATTRWRARRRD